MRAWFRWLLSRWSEWVPGILRVALAKWAEWIALGGLQILNALRSVTPSANPSTALQMLHRDVVGQYVPLVAGLSLVAIVGKAGQAFFSVESKRRVKAVLDALDETCFVEIPEGERYFNRITLFKANWRGTALKPYCRAGDRYQHDISSFRIDNNNEAHNEGVAGQAWFRGTTVPIELPEPPNPWTDADAACQEYARRGLLSAQKAGALHVRSRSILGTPVRDFKGVQWGVLVLDSRLPGALNPARAALARSFATALGKML